MTREQLEHNQIPVYLVAVIGAVLGGLLAPQAAPALGALVTPTIAVLMYAMFLQIPFLQLRQGLANKRFMAALLIANFVLIPLLVWGLTRGLSERPALLIGALLVLLTPCIDYVIVFAGLAGGAADRLLAAAPLLMLAQMLLLPIYLLIFLGPDGVAVVDLAPFARAFLLLIVVPLGAAALVQFLAKRHRSGQVIERSMLNLMVPLMMATLFTVVASQAGAVGTAGPQLLMLVPIYVTFLAIMVFVGLLAGRAFRLDVPATRALAFSGATRNSLVVLPLALALPPALALTPVVIVMQTLVELVGMVALVRLLPKMIRDR